MISVPLFFSRFSPKIRFATRVHRGLGDRPVHGVEAAVALIFTWREPTRFNVFLLNVNPEVACCYHQETQPCTFSMQQFEVNRLPSFDLFLTSPLHPFRWPNTFPDAEVLLDLKEIRQLFEGNSLCFSDSLWKFPSDSSFFTTLYNNE